LDFTKPEKVLWYWIKPIILQITKRKWLYFYNCFIKS